MINVILQSRVYSGELIQGKKKVENYHIHKLISTNKNEWIITKNHHEPIISKEDFDKVQEMIENNKCARSNKEKDIIIFQDGQVTINFKKGVNIDGERKR